MAIVALGAAACSESTDDLTTGTVEPPPTQPPPETEECEPSSIAQLGFGQIESLAAARDKVLGGAIPSPNQVSIEGVFAEHTTPLPPPCCDTPLCLQAEFGRVPDGVEGQPSAVFRIGINTAEPPPSADILRRNIVVGIDLSASLRSESAETLIRRFVTTLVDRLSDDDQLALVTFRNGPNLDVPMREVGGAQDVFRSAIDRLQFGGATNLWGGMEGALFHSLQNLDPSAENRVLVLTDGQPTWGSASVEDISRDTENYVRDGILLSIISVGDEQVDTITRRVGGTADGLWDQLNTPFDIEAILGRQLGVAWQELAQDLTLSVRSRGQPVRPIQGSALLPWNGNNGRLRRQSVLISSDGELRTPGAGAGGGSVLTFEVVGVESSGAELEVELSYTAADGTRHLDTVVVGPIDSGNDEVVIPSDEMGKALLVHDAARNLDRALTLVSQGQPALALDYFAKMSARQSDYLAENEASQDDVQAMRALINDLSLILVGFGHQPAGQLAQDDDPWPSP